MAESVLIPLKQTIITIARLTLIAVLLPDGQAGLVLASLCKGLDLQTGGQTRHLREHPTLSAALVLAQVEIAGKTQVANVLLAWGVPLWLSRIRLDGRPPVYRRRVLALQRGAITALTRHFGSAAVQASAQGALPEPRTARHTLPPEQSAASQQQSGLLPAGDVSLEELEGINTAIRRLETRLDEVKAELLGNGDTRPTVCRRDGGAPQAASSQWASGAVPQVVRRDGPARMPAVQGTGRPAGP